MAVDLAPLEGLVVALSALVGSGRLWSPAVLGIAIDLAPLEGRVVALSALVGSGWSAVVAGGAVALGIAIDLAPLEGLVVALSALVGCGRLWSPAALSYWELQ